jgi:formamidopyrimidine-DNA glycosylase
MPELPEVETIKNDARALLLGHKITAVDLRDPTFVARPNPDEFVARLRGQELVSADRQAKYLLLGLSSGDVLAVQLMITGQLLLLAPVTPLAKNTRLLLDLDTGNQLRLVDNNGYARVHIVSGQEMAEVLRLNTLGPDPTTPEFSFARFEEVLHGRRGRLKPLLLDQHFLAGLGNIYVDEALFQARLHPSRLAHSLSDEERRALYAAIRDVLLTGIDKRGTTIATYRDLLGRKGGYQQELKVFRRTGKPCVRCKTPISQVVIGGRDTHFCPNCQRE